MIVYMLEDIKDLVIDNTGWLTEFVAVCRNIMAIIAITKMFNKFFHLIKELLSKPTLVVVDTTIPLEYTSAVEVELGNVSLGAPSATCSVEVVNVT